SQWGWHTAPLPAGLDPNGLRLTQYDTHGRSVGYHTSSEGQTELFNWLRQNPHRLNLGRIGLNLSKGDVGGSISDISEINQKLDLWSGSLESNFKFDGVPISVRTAVHPASDLLAVEINSTLVENKNLLHRLSVRFGFPYGSPEMSASDWPNHQRHKTTVTQTDYSARIHRQ